MLLRYPEIIKYGLVASSLIRDILIPILLAFSNTILLVQYRHNEMRKRELVVAGHKVVNKYLTIMKHDLTLMTLSITLKSLICRIPMFVSRFYYIFPLIILNRPFYILTLSLFHLSYLMNFFIYLRFNRKYRYVFLGIFKLHK